MLIDSHAHLTMPQFDQDREAVIERAKNNGIEYIVTVGIDINDCRENIKIAESYEFIYAAVGIHPHDVKAIDGNTYEKLKELSCSPKVVALGEIGLDFFRNLKMLVLGERLDIMVMGGGQTTKKMTMKLQDLWE